MTLKTDMLTDLTAFFNSNEFAEDALYTPAYVAPAVAAPVTIKVIYNKEYDAMSGVGGFRYYIQAKTADVAAAKPGETLVIDGVTYKLRELPHYNDDGISEIELSID